MVPFATILIFLQLIFDNTQDIPYRDKDTYKLSLKMEFKLETPADVNQLELSKKKRYSNEPKLFLNTSLEILTLLEYDHRVRIIDNNDRVLISKRLKSPNTFLFKLGYAHYMKDKQSANMFVIDFLNKEKKVMSQIVIEIKEDGDFLVNNERFGKI